MQTTDGKHETLSVTANHPFWLKGKGWTETDLLRSGDLIEAKDGKWLTVASVQTTQEKAIAYNLEVENDHTYFVGDNQVWVHNTGCEKLARKALEKMGGGEVLRMEPTRGQYVIDANGNAIPDNVYPDSKINQHEAALKDGMVYDPMFLDSELMIPRSEYERLWDRQNTRFTTTPYSPRSKK